MNGAMHLRWACLALLVAWPASASAWSTMPCSGTNGGRWYYANNAPWPVALGPGMPPGDWARAEVERALSTWSEVDGATGGLSVHPTPFGLCQSEDDAGFGVVAWDGGACMAAVGSGWGPSSTGITIHWGASDCRIQRVVVYFNSNLSWTAEQLYNTALHELGHYQVYQHNWHELSVMGYSGAVRGGPTPAMDFLTARDHHFARAIYPDGSQAPAELHVHPYLQLDALGQSVIPDVESYDHAPPPSCSGGCGDVRAGDTISVQVTAGNTGAVDVTEPIDLVMTLGDREIGVWTQDEGLPAQVEWSFELTATVPDDMAGGTWPLRIEIDPDGVVPDRQRPTTAGRAIDYPPVTVICTPQCAPGACGDDGCGGSCGECPDTMAEPDVATMQDVADTALALDEGEDDDVANDATTQDTARPDGEDVTAGVDAVGVTDDAVSPMAEPTGEGCGCRMGGGRGGGLAAVLWAMLGALGLAWRRRKGMNVEGGAASKGL